MTGRAPREAALAALPAVRHALLELHRVLLQSERTDYERSHGRIESNSRFLQLLISDEAFAWLRPFTELIVQIDERLDATEPDAPPEPSDLLRSTRALLQPDGAGGPFHRRYEAAFQRDPPVAFAHLQLVRALESAALSAPPGPAM